LHYLGKLYIPILGNYYERNKMKKSKFGSMGVKTVGANGQISLGNEYAGVDLKIYKTEEGTIIIKPGKFIPDNEMWLYQGDNLERLNKAIAWAESTPRRDNADEILRILEERINDE
jgi:hypothetical protein